MNAAEIFDVVTGKSKKPILAKIGNETEDEARKRHSVDYSIWKRADNKAQKYFVTLLDEQPLQYIMNCDTANGMWNKLRSFHTHPIRIRSGSVPSWHPFTRTYELLVLKWMYSHTSVPSPFRAFRALSDQKNIVADRFSVRARTSFGTERCRIGHV
ncbi:unnamed protein product [Macrosiphum euphorbiae]|uniref:Uncharacterized protein n=1 Tax=Macrosiphum euphorbiae TaxID=13131 RepID=A0AAV0WTF4_9HEMI|nr:unnamed protein product [Macrosiphum euphorbiae]